MRSVYLVLWFFVGLVLGGYSVVSSAGERYPYGGTTNYKTAMDICGAAVGSMGSDQHDGGCTQGISCPSSQNGGGCTETATAMTRTYNSQPFSLQGWNKAWSYCPDDKPHWDGAVCVVEDPCKNKKGQAVGTSAIWTLVTSTPTNNTICMDGCTVKAQSVMCAPNQPAGGASGDFLSLTQTCEAQGAFIHQGYKCSSGVPEVAAPHADPPKPYYDNGKGVAECAKTGGAWGQINGVDTCVKSLTSGTAGGAGSGAGVSGSSSKTATESTTNPDGSVTKKDTTTETTCKDGNCTTTITTTTTTTKADGTKTESTDGKATTDQQTDFCKANPMHQLCVKNDFSGTCDTGFICSGDAVQCASAKALWETRCASKWMTTPGEPKDIPQTDVGEKKITKNFVWSDLFGAGSCPPDRHIMSIVGLSVDFTFSSFCELLEMIRPVVIAAAWITALYIVFGYKSAE